MPSISPPRADPHVDEIDVRIAAVIIAVIARCFWFGRRHEGEIIADKLLRRCLLARRLDLNVFILIYGGSTDLQASVRCSSRFLLSRIAAKDRGAGRAEGRQTEVESVGSSRRRLPGFISFQF